MSGSTQSLFNVVDDLAHANLGDKRRTIRLARVAKAIQNSPGLSLPRVFADPSQLNAAYRLLASMSKDVSAASILEPHRVRTAQRAALAGTVLVLHDTTSFRFGGGGRPDMGVVDPSDSTGFYMHSSLCVGVDGEPLGVARAHLWHRSGETHGKRSRTESMYDPNSESWRWNDAVHEVDDQMRHEVDVGKLGRLPRIIHVMDREADCLVLLTDMLEHDRSFIVRADADRRLVPGRRSTDDKLFAGVARTDVQATRVVKVVRRVVKRKDKAIATTDDATKKRRQRTPIETWSEMRSAQLEIRAMRTRIYGSNGCHAFIPPEGLEVSVVYVQEIDAPQGVEPVCWYLLTDQPVGTAWEIEFVVDCYCRRWLIEEMHKAIKTGCGYEKHQFEHGEQYYRMLSIVLPIAVQALRARWYSREHGDADASLVYEADQIEALRIHMHQKRKTLSTRPTVVEVFLLVARLGGHLPQNGAPGWLVLWRGHAKLAMLTESYRAFRAWESAKQDASVMEPEHASGSDSDWIVTAR